RLRLINEFSNWTSDDDGLDRFIQQTQLETPDPRYHMQWIPFESFSDIKFVAKGGHSSVFSATWLNKTDQVWDGAKQAFIEKPLIVALKSLKNSQELSEEFLDEFKRHGSLKLDGCGYIVHCHGVTRNPETHEYMMVMNYAEDGDLRHYVQKNMTALRWKDVVEMLCSIAMGLLNVHKN
ncbi:8053_t:CDS:2, partial [Scutellospora calospora]